MNSQDQKLQAAEVIRSKRPTSIIVNPIQVIWKNYIYALKFIFKRGNPVLKYVHYVPWEQGEILADYELGKTTCALFLSLRYHKLHPNYIYERFQKLGKNYLLRILLVLVDVVRNN